MELKPGVTAIILAAGHSVRFGAPTPKQFLRLYGKTILEHTLDVFQATPCIDRIIVVVSESRMSSCAYLTEQYENLTLIEGGERRQDSTANGLRHVTTDIVVMHDAVRPLVTSEDIELVVEAARAQGAATCVCEPADTMGITTGRFVDTLSRPRTRRILLPQAFKTELLRHGYERALRDITSDTDLMEVPVVAVESGPHLHKISYPQDLALVEYLLARRQIIDSPTAINSLRAGQSVIIFDSVEGEGDLCVPAELMTQAMLNFMLEECRGIICQVVTPARAQELGLKPQVEDGSPNFAVSVDAIGAYGFGSGTSAGDRVRTILALADPRKGSDHFRFPGHIQPLISHKEGLLARQGHTEASLELVKQAGFYPSSVICEILDDAGEMASLPALVKFATKHGLEVTDVEHLVEYVCGKPTPAQSR